MKPGFLRIGPLSRRLLAIAVAALLPVVILSLFNLVSSARLQRAELERTTIETIRALTSAVDKDLELSASALRVLSGSTSLTNDDLARFKRTARRALENFPAWENLILADVAGRELLKIAHPEGEPLGRVADYEAHQAVVRTGDVVVGGVAPDPVSRSRRYSIQVPAVRDGKVLYVVSALVNPESMLHVLYHQRMMAQGVISVLDARGNIVARSRGQAEFVGKPPSPSVQELLRTSTEGWGAATGLQDERFYTAFSRSEKTGWTVVAGMRRDIIDGPLRDATVALAMGIVLSLILGIVATLTASRIITRPINDLRKAARAYGRGETFDPPKTRLPELRDLAHALAVAQADRDRLLHHEREARTAAERANRSKDEFLAMLGHELRNPLAAISNCVAVLRKTTDTANPNGQDVTQVLRRQTDHLTHLMDDLLDVGRAVTGKITLERKPLDLADIVKQTVGTFQSTGRLAGHRVEVEAQPVWVVADATRMEQVCANLLVNACKFTPAGRGIRVSVAPEGQHAVLRVSDEGIGIEPGLADTMFELFVQGKQLSDPSRGGLGIGLTLVKRLVELHEGTVEAHSEGRDQGSTFVVRLPAAAAAVEIQPIRIAPYNPRRVLIVEDDADERETLRALLTMQGHTVYEAADGPGAVAAALHHMPDVVLLDVGLPGYDGHEAARRIRAEVDDSVRLIAISGYGSTDDRRRASQAGFDMHLVKPVAEAVLDEAISGAPRAANTPTLPQD